MADGSGLSSTERRLPTAGKIEGNPELLRQIRSRVINEALSGGQGDAEVVACGPVPDRYVLAKSRCGADRDCIPDDRFNPFYVAWCSALSWCALGNGRYVEIWDKDNRFRLLKVTERTVTDARTGKCGWTKAGGIPPAPGSQS